MHKHGIDTVLLVKLKHRPGQLARLATAVGAEGAVIGDIKTLRVGEVDSVREVTVETDDEAHTDRVVAAVRATDGVDLLDISDRVFACHKGGKLHSTSRVPLKKVSDLRAIYTPGVARVARSIERDPEQAWDLTGIGNSVGIFTNGSRVLGLGNIGPIASLPVMEGKAVIYDTFVGISATPILIDTLDVRTFIDTVLHVSATFGGIHLEDIQSPDCYKIEAELIARLDKPVMHDDQHGTATVALAAVINACKMTGTELARAHVGQIGLGAAGSAIARLMIAYGVGDVLVHDRSKEAMDWLAEKGAHPVDLPTLMKNADIVIAATGRPGLITPAMVKPGQILFPLSNPDAEIDPVDARQAGAAFAADGRSINNALAFPGLFRGALDVRSRAITHEMMIAAARTIAAHAEPGEVVPSPLDSAVHQAVRDAVIAEARAKGLEGTARVTRALETVMSLRRAPLPLLRADLDRVLEPLERASQLPSCAYLDAAIFAFERDTIFAKAWICVGREDEIALPGEWIRATVAGEDMLVVRGADLVCRAFYNVCRHRGAPLESEACGRAASLRCPYHGWTYELSGALRDAPHTAGIEGFDPAEQGLSRARVEAWQGFLFVTLDEGAPPLADHLDPPPERLARPGLRHLRRGRRVAYTVQANWKLLIENFQESLHFPLVHPGLERLTPKERADSVLGDGPWLGGLMDIAEGAETVSIDGKLHGRPYLAGITPEDTRRVFDAMLFPALLLSLQPDYLLTYRLTPQAPAETRVTFDIHFHPAAFVTDFDPAHVYAFWDRVNAEDRAICELQQAAMPSRGRSPGRYTSVEDGVHAFDRLVARRYAAALEEGE